MTEGRNFTTAEADALWDIIRHRRDVRGNRFADKPLEAEVVDRILDAAMHAPSVGFSQPWEFVLVEDREVRRQVRASFEEVNERAQGVFGHRGGEYARLKLEGILEAALNIAVFYVPPAGPVLGQTAMEEVGLYSVVCAVQNMWLMARALNVGMGWVSILEPERVRGLLGAPEGNRLVAYLCVGYTDGFYDQPELELLQWEKRKMREKLIRKI
ncbi:MAG TPA: 5,6-dimethylbenzimidazole synthase [Puia sp.]